MSPSPTRWYRFVSGAAGALLVTLALPGATASGATSRPAGHGHGRATFAPGSVLVSFRDGVGAGERARALRAAGARPGPALGVRAQQLHVAAGTEDAVVAALRAQPSVRYAEPDYLSEPTGLPDDPGLPQQWPLQNTGQTVNGVTGAPGADADVVPAWTVTTGTRDVVVAEVDTGVDYTHPDLAANIWTNDGSVGGCPAGTHGVDVLTNACDPMDDDTTFGGHGTHVAGIIGAVGGNGTGVAGVNWQTTILPVKWIGASGAGATSDLLRALGWVLDAQAHGVNVRVVNDSNVFVGTAFSQALSDEIDLLAQHDILFVTAAGSTGGDNDDPAARRYPCAYARSNELCTTWTDQQDALPATAGHGATSVDLAAPGDNVYSTLIGGGYGYVSGGSMAAAEVSGAAALVLSAQSMSTGALKADLLEHVAALPSLSGRVRTGGRLDVCAAVPGCGPAGASDRAPFAVTPPPVTAAQSDPGHPGPEPQQGQQLGAGPGDWDFAPSSFSYAWSRCSVTGGSCVPLGSGGPTYVPTAADVGSTLQVTVSASNASGTTSSSSVPTLVVQGPPPGLTFGKTAVAATPDPADADYERLDAVTVPRSGSVTGLTVYLARLAAGSQSLRGVVYADASGRPGALLGSTAPLTLDAGAGDGWVSLPFSAALPIGAGPAWIGVQFGGTSQVFALRYDESTAGSGAAAPAPWADGPLGASTAWGLQTEQVSVYGTLVVPPPVPPAPTVVTGPSVTGEPVVGRTLSAAPGTWTDGPTSFAYQWLRCLSGQCTEVPGATGGSYVLTKADAGGALEVRVVARNAGGPSAPAVSTPTGTVRVTPLVSLSACGTVPIGGTRVLTGRLGTDPLAAGGRVLSLQSLPYGQRAWSTIRTGAVTGVGTTAAVSWRVAPSRRTLVRAVFAGDPTAVPQVGATLVCSVTARVSLGVSATQVRHGATVHLYGSVAPGHAGRRVYVQVWEPARHAWRSLAAPTLSSRSTYSYLRGLGTRGTFVFRVWFPGDADHLGAVSPNRTVRVV